MNNYKSLSAREREVFDLLLQGFYYREISERLEISHATVAHASEAHLQKDAGAFAQSGGRQISSASRLRTGRPRLNSTDRIQFPVTSTRFFLISSGMTPDETTSSAWPVRQPVFATTHWSVVLTVGRRHMCRQAKRFILVSTNAAGLILFCSFAVHPWLK